MVSGTILSFFLFFSSYFNLENLQKLILNISRTHSQTRLLFSVTETNIYFYVHSNAIGTVVLCICYIYFLFSRSFVCLLGRGVHCKWRTLRLQPLTSLSERATKRAWTVFFLCSASQRHTCKFYQTESLKNIRFYPRSECY